MLTLVPKNPSSLPDQDSSLWQSSSPQPPEQEISVPTLVAVVAADPSHETEDGKAASLPFLPLATDLLPILYPDFLKGSTSLMAKSRSPFIGEVVSFPSPLDPEVTFGIKRLGNRAVIQYRDKNSVVRFISEEGTNRYIQEKDYPTGTNILDTVVLGLDSWNITDAVSGNPVTISQESILSYLDPDELDFVAEKVLEVNSILTGNRKNDSTTSSPSN